VECSGGCLDIVWVLSGYGHTAVGVPEYSQRVSWEY